MSDKPPLARFAVCRMWQRTSYDGTPFWSGRWGAARVLLVPNRERGDGDDATHLLVLGEAEPTTRKPKKDRPQ